MATVLAGLLACLSVLAQSAAQAPAPASGTAQISGTIRNAADNSPLGRARVVATADVLQEPRATITNGDGTYAFTDLPAGAYTIAATRTGFAAQTYGRSRAARGTPVVVAAGQRVDKIDLTLASGSVIAGRILDEDGSPFAGAVVEALVTRSDAGTRTLLSVANTQTDDRGEFRLYGLGPGEYYVSAQDPAFRAVSSPTGVLHYSPTYSPGTALADQAKAIAISGTGEPSRVEFRIRLVPPARVTGQLITSDGKPLLSAVVVISPVERGGAALAPPTGISILPDGRFLSTHVAPGRYQIRAQGQTDPAGAALFAVFAMEVLGSDVSGIRMTLRPGALVDGRVIVESRHATKWPMLATVRVRAPFSDDSTFGDALTGAVQPDGTFAIRGVMHGAHQFALEGLQPPWVIKSVMLRGSDITDVEVPIDERAQIHDVRITITDAGSSVSGVVHDARNLPAANTGVMVFSKVPLFWLRTNRRMRVTSTDGDGRFTISGLPAGEYLAVASDSIDEGDLGRRDRLQVLQALAVPFRLASDDGRATVTLRVTPLIPMPAVR